MPDAPPTCQAADATAEPTAARPPRLVVRVAVALVASLAALALAELAAGTVYSSAYPYLNVYLADPDYGVRLAPGAETAVRSPGGRVTDVRITDIRINSAGFRGPDWAPPSPSDAADRLTVLVLGDSQAFGYGVAWDASLGPQLARLLGPAAQVRVAAVPTWGPAELVAALAELGPTLQPDVVLLLVNLANDWAEAPVPNRLRTTARDGWAAHPGPGGAAPSGSPLRRWLLGRSHLVLAVRELLARHAGPPPTAAVSPRRLLASLAELSRPAGAHASRLTPHVLAARQRCAALGCRLVVAALPCDVQVDPREWAKYSAAPLDARPLAALTATLLGELRAHGVAAIDLLAALRAASPGAFLPDDYHLSPQGHAAVAAALAPLVRATAAAPRLAQSPPPAEVSR
jgi:lysophospholipase L1-like esterase